MTLCEALDNFIYVKRLEALSNKSIINYQDFLNMFINYIGRDTDILSLKQHDIDNYIEYQVKRNISRNTFATYIRHLKIFIKWLCESFPVQFSYKNIKVPKSTKKSVRIYSNKEIKTIFETTTNSIEWIEKRNKAIISLMLDSGIRQGEVVSLLKKRIFLEDNRMCVTGKGSKERFVPIGNYSIKLYNDYISCCPYNSDYAFIGKNGKRITENTVKLFIQKLSLKLPFEFSSHKLRHNFATNYCLDMYHKNGHIDAYRLMTIMGHEDIKTTQKYLHIANEIIASSECLSHLDSIEDL